MEEKEKQIFAIDFYESGNKTKTTYRLWVGRYNSVQELARAIADSKITSTYSPNEFEEDEIKVIRNGENPHVELTRRLKPSEIEELVLEISRDLCPKKTRRLTGEK